MTHHFAVIDLGSNSARMTIWEIEQEVVKPIKRLKEMVRLSEDMGPDRVLQPAAMDRTLKALQGFKTELNKYADIDLKAVATAAVRQAKNQKEFLKRVKNEAGLIINVIPGTREAEYDFLGVINTLPIQNALIMDTGGASTELILVQNRKLQHLVSIPFGSVNLSERFLNPDVISAPEYFALSTFIRMRLLTASGGCGEHRICRLSRLAEAIGRWRKSNDVRKKWLILRRFTAIECRQSRPMRFLRKFLVQIWPRGSQFRGCQSFALILSWAV